MAPSTTPHLVQWDVGTNRPVVDGKIIDPKSGELVKAEGPFTTGPPAIDIIWHNMNFGSPTYFKGARMTKPVSLERLYLEIGKHVSAGKYRLVSVNASAYSFVIVCESEMSMDDGDEMLKGMFSSG